MLTFTFDFCLLTFALAQPLGLPLILLIVLLGVGLLAAPVIIAAMSRHKKSATGVIDLAGSRGLVESTLEPEGAVLIDGELWRARSREGTTVTRGSKVRVVGAHGHLLEVEAIE